MSELNRKPARRFLAVVLALLFTAFTAALFFGAVKSGLKANPEIDPRKSAYDSDLQRLVLKGKNFRHPVTAVLDNGSFEIQYGSIEFVDSSSLIVHGVSPEDFREFIDVVAMNPNGRASKVTRISFHAVAEHLLTEDDVRRIIAQAVTKAEQVGLQATVTVVDQEANVLGLFIMEGSTECTVVSAGREPLGGLEGAVVPSFLAAISKAGTGTMLSSQGHSFTTRTASFIIQQHFPPGISFTASGPLFGVQFSQLPCSDINPALPLGLSADPGGIALYKNGMRVGGLGVEGDGIYTFDSDPSDKDLPPEEIVAVAATHGYETPPDIRADLILINGLRLPFVNAPLPEPISTPPFEELEGEVHPLFPIRNPPSSKFDSVTIDDFPGRVDNRFFPFKGGSQLTDAEVERIIVQAAQRAFLTRAAIRRPLGSAAEVNIAVTDADGTVLGVFSTPDAPLFGFDVSVQKARTAAFLSNPTAGDQLRSAEDGKFIPYVEAGAREGLRFDGSIAMTDRAGGFLSRPFFPDGIDGTENGPFSVPIERFSPFNNGLQLDLVTTAIVNALSAIPTCQSAVQIQIAEMQQQAFQDWTSHGRMPAGGAPQSRQELSGCTAISGLANGLQIFPGSVPLYKNGRLAGGIGISGDGVEQDDIIAAFGSAGFEAPPGIRADRFFVRGVRLPYVKFPRHPNR